MHMAINEKVAEVLEDQINKELYSSYLYLTFADYYDDRGLKGFANWYEIQPSPSRTRPSTTTSPRSRPAWSTRST